MLAELLAGSGEIGSGSCANVVGEITSNDVTISNSSKVLMKGLFNVLFLELCIYGKWIYQCLQLSGAIWIPDWGAKYKLSDRELSIEKSK